LIFAASVGDQITKAVADVAEGLRYPVLIAAMIALLLVAWELGRLGVEAWKRSQLPKVPFEHTAAQALAQAHGGDTAGAQATLRSYAYGDSLQKAAVGTLFAGSGIEAQRAVVEYDLYVSKRLDRVRLLVRAGPALGLMGTLIPLAPALAALGKGQPSVLADELQTAFAITVVGVLVGLVAFSVALVRERYYTRDLADLEYLRELRGDAVIIAPATVPQPASSAATRIGKQDKSPASPPLPADAAAVTRTGAPAAAPTTPAATPPATPYSPAQPIPGAPRLPATPQAPVVPGTTPPIPGATPPAFPQPSVPETPKRRFGFLKKNDEASAVTPPAFPTPPPAPTIPSVEEATKIQDAPAAPEKPADVRPDADAAADDSSEKQGE
jgi:biopolymer transport protein ExbB/TolQ